LLTFDCDQRESRGEVEPTEILRRHFRISSSPIGANCNSVDALRVARVMGIRSIAIAGAATVCIAAVALWLHPRIPDHWNPWADLRLEETPNFLTRHKLARLSSDDELCRATLATSSFRFTPLEDRTTGPACGLYNAVRIAKTSVDVGKAFSLTCRTAVSLALWEQHSLQPAAQRHFGHQVARIEHFGSYACRNVNGKSNGRRSQHATAEAFDIAGFVLEDGTRIRVLNDWQNADARSDFLHEIRSDACQFFDAVLSPSYNEAHRDHFHFDRGSWRTCR
jgi:hypothetical protein